MLVETNGVRLNCEMSGREGAPWITCSHALANNLTLWDEFTEAFSDRFRILRYDNRGHGQSEAPLGPYTFPMLLQDVTGLWDRLGIDRSHWIGLSIGGMIGYGLGIHHPDRVLSIAALDSRPDAPPDYAAYFQSRIDKARAGGMDAVVESTITRWFTPETVAANPPVLDRVRAMIRSTSPIGHEGCCEALKTLAYGPDLHRIQAATLFMGGEQDKGAPPNALADAAAQVAGASHLVIPAAGHISLLENLPAAMAALRGWFAKFA